MARLENLVKKESNNKMKIFFIYVLLGICVALICVEMYHEVQNMRGSSSRVYGAVYDGKNIVKEFTPVIARCSNGKTLETTTRLNGSYEFFNLPNNGLVQLEACIHGKEDCAWEMPVISLINGMPQKCDIVVPDMGYLEYTIKGVEDFDNTEVFAVCGNYKSRIRNKHGIYKAGTGKWILECNGIKSQKVIVARYQNTKVTLNVVR